MWHRLVLLCANGVFIHPIFLSLFGDFKGDCMGLLNSLKSLTRLHEHQGCTTNDLQKPSQTLDINGWRHKTHSYGIIS